jgi:hypothetical protein
MGRSLCAGRRKEQAVQEIDVFLLKDASGGAKIQTEPAMAGVHSGDSVLWHFHSLLGNDVNWVEIDFAQGDDGHKAKFFDARGHVYDSRRFTELKNGHGHIMGTAPELPGGAGTRGDKYFVRGYKAMPNPYDPGLASCVQDPDIITCDP